MCLVPALLRPSNIAIPMLIFGIGGPKMIAAGLRSAYEQEKLAVRGAAEVVAHLPEILSIRRGITAQLKAWQPDVMIGIDAPDFNLFVERQLKKPESRLFIT